MKPGASAGRPPIENAIYPPSAGTIICKPAIAIALMFNKNGFSITNPASVGLPPKNATASKIPPATTNGII